MKFKYNYRYILFFTFVASLAGLIFGCDIAVVAGTIGFLKTNFQLNAQLTGWVVSSVIVGCIFGALLGGPMGDRYGRKWSLFGCAILYVISSLLSASAQSISFLAVARFIGGISIGAASTLAPLYIAEIAPRHIRGTLVAAYQLAIVVAICAIFFINLQIQRMGNEAWHITTGWRWMFASLILPAGLWSSLMLTISESPRWLMQMRQREKAKTVLEKLGDSAHAQFEMQQVDQSLQEEEGRWSELFTTGYRRALGIGILLAIFTQLTGINAIMYYAPEIFKIAGLSSHTAFLQTAIIGVINLLFTLIAIWLVDRVGRKPLLLIGTLIQAVALFFMGFFLHRNVTGSLLLISVLVYVAAFAIALGPLGWIMISEIFPTKLRGRAMSLAILVMWTGNFLVTQTFPILNQVLGAGNTFWIYGFVSLLGFVFVLSMLPETKGRTLEEIERFWVAKTGS